MTKVEDAKVVLQGLEGKLSDARVRHVKIVLDAREVSFGAHTIGGEDRKRLDKLEAEMAKAAMEVASLESAIGEAKKRVEAAEADEVDEAELARARDALALLDSFAKRGDDLQQSLDKFIANYAELSKDFRQLEAQGYAPTTWSLVKVNMQAAVATGLQFTDLRQAFLAPHERRDFRAVIEGWARHIRGRAEARLNRNAAGKKAA
jgi:chromosome segregation ATPase